MFREEILENERRREVYRLLEKNPGLHLREIQRILKMPLTSLEYHLNYMVRKKVVLREKDSRYTRYYAKQLSVEDKKILASLRQKKIRDIALIVFSRGKVKYQELLNNFQIPPSTLSLYLKHLVDHNILTRQRIGRENIYTVQEEEKLAKVLMAYKSSFVDKLVDKALNTWMEMKLSK